MGIKLSEGLGLILFGMYLGWVFSLPEDTEKACKRTPVLFYMEPGHVEKLSRGNDAQGNWQIREQGSLAINRESSLRVLETSLIGGPWEYLP